MARTYKGKIISCCSRIKQSGNTSVAAIIATKLSEIYPEKNILVTDINNIYTDMQAILSCQHPKGENLVSLINIVGIADPIVNLQEKIQDCCVALKDNLFNINAAQNSLYNDLQYKENIFAALFDAFKEIFDIVVIDNFISDKSMSAFINKQSDVVVNVMDQNIIRLNQLFDTNQFSDIEKLNEDKIVTVLNKYIAENGLTDKELKKLFKFKNVYTLPYSCDLCFCFNNKSMLKFFKEYSENNTVYLKSLDKLLHEIITILGWEYESILSPKKKLNKNSFLGILKSKLKSKKAGEKVYE